MGSVPRHDVLLYTDVVELSTEVVAYLVDGFRAGEPAVVVATREHLLSFEQELAAAGWPLPALEQERLLFIADADIALAAIMEGAAEPVAAVFDGLITTLLALAGDARPAHGVRVYGEMVDLLTQWGLHAAAVRLEHLWNELARHRSFALLCAYELDVFDRATQSALLPGVCAGHSHMRPAVDASRFASAVDEALEHTLGRAGAGHVHVMADRAALPDQGVPHAQEALMWVSKHIPAAAERVLASARERYFAEPLKAA
jgi:hypothetical protein